MHIVRLLLSLLLIIFVHGVFQWYTNRAQEAGPDVPSGKLMSLSFAPFREGYSPLEHINPLPEHIDEDLRLLADKTDSIRTYSSLGGMQPTPELARKHGLTMIQGGWLGSSFKLNRQEMDALVASANANPDVVKRVIVGNEVLLRGDLDVDHLIGYIREVKRQVKQPVSYADVWSIYMKYPQLIKEVDFITIHILPYWEDEPISVQGASEHLEKIVKQVEDEARSMAAGKPILIGESGWPSVGRQRGLAVPGVVNEARFIRGLIQVAQHHGFDYNIVEAFNQPWKSHQEGVVGANWGLFSVDRQSVFPLTGLVSENSDWLVYFFAASVLLILISAAFFKKLQTLSTLRLFLFLFLAQVFCMCLVTLMHFLWYTSYSFWQRVYTVLIVAANAVMAVLLLRRSNDILAGHGGRQKLAYGLLAGYQLFILLALYKTFGLAVNGRYLSFPVEQFVIPAFGLLGLVVFLAISGQSLGWRVLTLAQLMGWDLHCRWRRGVAYLLSFAMVGMVFGEVKAFMDGRDFIQAHPGVSEGLPVALSYTLHNQELQAWLVCLLVLSIPFWARGQRT